MFKTRLPRPTYAGVVATLALFLALGGTAYATGYFNGANIINGTITAPKLKSHTLTGLQINMSKLGTVPNASHLAGKLPSAFLSASGTAVNSAKLGGLSSSQVLHGTSLTGSATFLALGSGPVLTIPGVGVLGATCSASGGGYDWTISTTGSDTYAVMPLTIGDGFFPVQSRYDDTDASNTYSPKLLDSAHTVTIHGGAGSGSTGFADSEAVVELVPVGGWTGAPVTLNLTGQGFNPQNTCVVRAFAQSWG